MSLPTWIQEAVGKGYDLSVCLELWKHASAIEREERMAEREEKKQEMELKRLAMEQEAEEKKQVYERDLEDKKRMLEKDMEEKRLQVRMRELEVREQELKSSSTRAEREVKEQKHEVKFLLPKYVEGEDIDIFLRSFERLANLHKWPKPDWALRLVPQ